MADDTTAGSKQTSDAPGQGSAAENAQRKPRRRPRVSAKQVAKGAKAGADAVRARVASLVRLVAAACAAILALAAVLTALDPANQQNAVVEWLTGTADALSGPIGGADGGVFDFGRTEEAKNALANWGVAALVYLAGGRLLDRLVRP